jgi:hypothetical protein
MRVAKLDNAALESAGDDNPLRASEDGVLPGVAWTAAGDIVEMCGVVLVLQEVGTMIRKWIWWLATGFWIAFLLIQAVPYGWSHANPPIVQEPGLLAARAARK